MVTDIRNFSIENRKARYDYFVMEKLECGLSLRGNEVKSILDGGMSIKEAWIAVQDGELVLRGAHISAYRASNSFDVNENREIKLLAHKSEILKLQQQVAKDGVTLIPIKIYFSDMGKLKVEVGICKGKKTYDKRETIKQRDLERESERDL